VRRWLLHLVPGVVLLLIQTTFSGVLTIGPFRLEPLLVLIVMAGFTLPLFWGSLLAGCMGYAADVFSGGFLGLYTGLYLLAFYLSYFTHGLFNTRSIVYRFGLVFVVSLIEKSVLAWTISYLFDQPPLTLSSMRFILIQSLVSGVMGPPVIWLLERLLRYEESLFVQRPFDQTDEP
jgi:cell shape-determining protein MreD